MCWNGLDSLFPFDRPVVGWQSRRRSAVGSVKYIKGSWAFGIPGMEVLMRVNPGDCGGILEKDDGVERSPLDEDTVSTALLSCICEVLGGVGTSARAGEEAGWGGSPAAGVYNIVSASVIEVKERSTVVSCEVDEVRGASPESEHLADWEEVWGIWIIEGLEKWECDPSAVGVLEINGGCADTVRPVMLI
ncbi:hypothetical protein CYMTET_48128 [Cymbomonas tetramitiformis]|uniref:Uncharacterized protein n=1 Tax=Cymbomonas tetramitiformis TaxID=36881 RepID=A0AAE0BSV1_9CHLO|nr:hypothetical protein CYMTET_48128 [Cymbomonas tetramitiformis]